MNVDDDFGVAAVVVEELQQQEEEDLHQMPVSSSARAATAGVPFLSPSAGALAAADAMIHETDTDTVSTDAAPIATAAPPLPTSQILLVSGGPPAATMSLSAQMVAADPVCRELRSFCERIEAIANEELAPERVAAIAERLKSLPADEGDFDSAAMRDHLTGVLVLLEARVAETRLALRRLQPLKPRRPADVAPATPSKSLHLKPSPMPTWTITRDLYAKNSEAVAATTDHALEQNALLRASSGTLGDSCGPLDTAVPLPLSLPLSLPLPLPLPPLTAGTTEVLASSRLVSEPVAGVSPTTEAEADSGACQCDSPAHFHVAHADEDTVVIVCPQCNKARFASCNLCLQVDSPVNIPFLVPSCNQIRQELPHEPNRPTTEVTLVRLGSKQPARACKHWVNNGSEWEHFEGSARWPTVTASNTLDDDQAAAVPRDRFSLSTDDAAAPGRETGVGFKRRSNDGNQLNNEDSDTIEFNNECNVIKRAKHTHQFD